MDIEQNYYEITSELDPREILRYLNNLGIHNISGEVLKHFITDLKKYIKYDLHNKYNKQESCEIDWSERLHSASTFSSRIRSKVQSERDIKCSRECGKFPEYRTVRNVRSAPSLRPSKEEEKPLRRACSCVKVDRKIETSHTKNTGGSSNLIKVPKPVVKKKCDPVSLYHYYTSMWEKYKSNVPGENNWSDLRWTVRQKMAGALPKSHKVPVPDKTSKKVIST